MTTTRDAYESSTKSVVREALSPTRAVSDHPHRRTADEAAGTVGASARFAEAVLPLVNDLLRAARRLTRNNADAEDLVQETMLKAFAGFSTFQPGTNIKAWLLRIQSNTWISFYRARARRPEELLTGGLNDVESTRGQRLGPSARSAEQAALDTVADDDVKNALEGLTDPQRLVLYLADIEGFRYKEIARIAGVPLGTVMSRLHRARVAVRKHLLSLGDGRYADGRGL